MSLKFLWMYCSVGFLGRVVVCSMRETGGVIREDRENEMTGKRENEGT